MEFWCHQISNFIFQINNVRLGTLWQNFFCCLREWLALSITVMGITCSKTEKINLLER